MFLSRLSSSRAIQAAKHGRGALASLVSSPASAPMPSQTAMPAMATTRLMSIQRIGTDYPPMSKLVIHNGIVYMSGQVDTAASDIEGQTANVLAMIDEGLAEAGTSKSNLLTASVWLKDIEKDFETMNGIYTAWLDPDNKPVRATVESPMALPEILIEIQVTATTGE